MIQTEMLNTWSLTKTAMPFRVSEGATIPTITISRDLETGEDARTLHRQVESFAEASVGLVEGRYSNIQTGDGLTATVTDLVNVFNVTATTQPAVLSEFPIAFQYLVNLLGYPLGAITSTLPLGDYVFPGNFGSPWKLLGEVCAVSNVQMVINGTDVHFSPALNPGVFVPLVTTLDLTESPTETLDQGNPSRYLEIINYKTHYQLDSLEFYPESVDDAPVIQVDAGERVETEITLRGWLALLNQPVCVDWVEADPDFYNQTQGVYSVSGSDGRPVPAAQWLARGGSLTVEMTDRPDVLKVIVTGAQDESFAPYRIAMTSGNYYSSLRITGIGIQINPETLRFATGVDPAITTEDVGSTIDSTVITNAGQALNMANREARLASGYAHSMTFSTDDAEVAEYVGKTLYYRNNQWRVEQVSMSDSGSNVTCSPVSALGDLEAIWSGKTLGDFQAHWVGKTLGDLIINPLSPGLEGR